MKVGRKPANRSAAVDTAVGRAVPARGRRTAEAPRRRRARGPVDPPARPARTRTRPQEPRSQRPGPQTAPAARPTERPARPKSASQAKARAKARKAKAPRVIRRPLRERVLARLATIDLSPRTLIARIPFVVLVIGALAVGLAITLWLSTDSAQRSYQLSSARALNAALSQQMEALERDVLEAQSAPALADAARDLGMIPSRETAHLVKDPTGSWVVVGEPRPAEGVPPPPLNFKLPEENPAAKPRPAPSAGPAPRPGAEVEVPVLLPPPPNPFSAHGAAGAAIPGPLPLPGPPELMPGVPTPAPEVVGDTLVIPPPPDPAPPVPTVVDVAPVAPGIFEAGAPDAALAAPAVEAPH